MKIDKLDAHDRLLDFTKKDFSIAECIDDFIRKRPFGDHSFYLFVHPRTDDDGVSKRLIWQPRLTKPKSQTNSMLFKVNPKNDLVKIIWIIPCEEIFEQYKKGFLTESQIVTESIYNFIHNRDKLDKKEDDDLPDWKIDSIYEEISKNSKKKQKN